MTTPLLTTDAPDRSGAAGVCAPTMDPGAPANANIVTELKPVTDENVGTLPFVHRVANLAAVLLPIAGLVIAIVLLWGVAFDWRYLAILVGMYTVTGLGITIGYHRLFTHKSFETGPVCTWIWAVLGSMAVEGPILRWAAMHRKHHQHSDAPGDPHSPYVTAGEAHHAHEEVARGGWAGIVAIIRGLWHAHVGWIFSPHPPDLDRYVKDLKQDRVVASVSRQFPLWVVVGLAIPTILGGLVSWSWTGAALGLLWGGAVRVFLVHHITWSINSVCHIWGSRPYESHDESRNNPVFGILGFGEGWHNNHHAFPTSARHGLAWWQIDTSYMLIRAMELVGLARRVRVPGPERMAAKRRVPAKRS